MFLFELEYPITRPFRWRWIGRLSYSGAVIVILLLTILNVALVGYETVSIFHTDFNATQTLWYHRFMPSGRPEPGSLCENRHFKVGDNVRVHGGTLEWIIVYIKSLETNSSVCGFPYGGAFLSQSSCDVTSILVDFVNQPILSAQQTVILECGNLNGFYVLASACLSPFTGNKSTSNFHKLAHLDTSGHPKHTFLRSILSVALNEARGEALHPPKAALHLKAHLTPCSTPNGCVESAPNFNGTILEVGTSSNDYFPHGFLDRNTEVSLWNFVQTIHAAVKVDLSIESPNNFLLHKEALPFVLGQTIPAKSDNTSTAYNSSLYDGLQAGTKFPGYPFALSKPSNIQAEYLCKYQQLKSTGSLIGSVFVAVVSMFTSMWAVYLSILATLSRRSLGGNVCVMEHDTYNGLEAAALPRLDKDAK